MVLSDKLQLPVAVCAAVIVDNDRVLITKRPDDKKLGGFWEFPGGKMDADESPAATVIREIKEELNIEVTVDTILETVYHRYDWGRVLIIAYLCSWQGGVIEHREVADHAWVTPDQFSDYPLLPADMPILDKIRAHLSPDNPGTKEAS